MQALCKCSGLPAQLLNQILHPAPSPAPRKQALASSGLQHQLTAMLQKQYNASQQDAIAAAASRRQQAAPFTLVQVSLGKPALPTCLL